MAPVFQGMKKPRASTATGQVPWTHRRPSYPLSGCVPAEPDSVSPGTTILPCRRTGGKYQRGGWNRGNTGL